ncbi:MAG TPA: hypothetical protein ENI61_00195 [Ignavibacteria bacterium]|nr:hypothetical protein [Ignavibacteria bacterium]
MQLLIADNCGFVLTAAKHQRLEGEKVKRFRIKIPGIFITFQNSTAVAVVNPAFNGKNAKFIERRKNEQPNYEVVQFIIAMDEVHR